MKRNVCISHSVGAFGEQYAVRYLRRHGYAIRARNYRAGHREIDIVATTPRTVAFVEVKARSYRAEELDLLPPPGHAVNAEKQRLTRRAAGQYLYEHPSKKKPRMDVIEIWLEASDASKKPRVLRIRHLKGAY